ATRRAAPCNVFGQKFLINSRFRVAVQQNAVLGGQKPQIAPIAFLAALSGCCGEMSAGTAFIESIAGCERGLPSVPVLGRPGGEGEHNRRSSRHWIDPILLNDGGVAMGSEERRLLRSDVGDGERRADHQFPHMRLLSLSGSCAPKAGERLRTHLAQRLTEPSR